MGSTLQVALESIDLDSTAFAYISTPAPTITTVAGSYYKVEGVFTNETLDKFSINASFNLQYDGTSTKLFKIVVSATLSSDTVNSVVTAGLEKNGVLEPNSLMSVKLVQTSDKNNITFVDLIELSTGDEIKIVLTSDQVGAEITAETLTTSAIAIIKQ